MNFRSKTTAMALCFFLGALGVHWFYLGRAGRGWVYLFVFLAAWPASLVGAPLLSESDPVLLGFAFIFPLVAWASILLLAFVDFCRLLCMEPRRFDGEYNPDPY